ncbi:uncharacterized protein LOC123010153 [Tribolium madens]|uniref:uncharacterized protein LOC123010153 n=1 Tax=Tribolium madens TaxID=41895 RepID=UPI001CF74156|nr:uncharacterized protein LOC123010153 [Tribolium madens]
MATILLIQLLVVSFLARFCPAPFGGRVPNGSPVPQINGLCFKLQPLFLPLPLPLIWRKEQPFLSLSDNGTNFVGANRELCRLMRFAVNSQSIQWSFNPPSAPHFGGLWESGIKSVKTHIDRVVGSQVLMFEQLYTLVVQTEALLNSRPLCPLNNDPNNLRSLTPGHFLTLEPLTAPPNPDLSHLKISNLSRWQLVQRMQQEFWKRWHNEYLHTLYQRRKWAVAPLSLVDIGSLVLLKDELSPPLQWKMGRIESIHSGPDGHVHVATIQYLRRHHPPTTIDLRLPTGHRNLTVPSLSTLRQQPEPRHSTVSICD